MDASTFRARPFLDALDAALPPGTTVLGGSPTPGVPALLAAGGEVHRCHDAALAVQLRGTGITAVDPASGAVFVSRGIAAGARVGVARPDPDGQPRDRHDMLGDLRRRAGTRPTFGLLVGQVAAGGPADLAAAFPELPFVGWRSHTTLGSAEGRPEVLAHAELVGVFR